MKDKCPQCGRMIGIQSDGTYSRHRSKRGARNRNHDSRYPLCSGSRQKRERKYGAPEVPREPTFQAVEKASIQETAAETSASETQAANALSESAGGTGPEGDSASIPPDEKID